MFTSLKTALADFPEIAQQRWAAWLKKQKMETVIPTEFSAALDLVISFADPVLAGDRIAGRWDSA
jgi:hypothetical protein